MDKRFENIPKEKFQFSQMDASIHDKKFETKARGYFADALIRFRKNSSSVIGAFIIGALILFSIVSPFLTVYTIDDTDTYYNNYPPYSAAVADLNIGVLDGGVVLLSQSKDQIARLEAMGQESGMNPVIRILGEQESITIYRGQERKTISYKVRVNKYFVLGVVYRVISYDEFAKIQQFQNETGIQVIYPYVFPADVVPEGVEPMGNNPNTWYKVVDSRGNPLYDANGELVPAYSTDLSKSGTMPYTSIRIEGDDGSYIYSASKSNSVQVRINYYNYYQYLHGYEPNYLFGTNVMGQDLFCAIGIALRFSLIFAIVVSAINLTIGAFYGAIQGYYGGVADLLMDRLSDILSGVPMTVVIVLFQLHLAEKMGSVGAFLLAFVATGWIGMSALTRHQFYRFKGHEYVLAAKTLGASDGRMMFKHIFPNSLGTIITSCALVIPGVVSSETQLTYLGIINLSELAGTSIGTLMAQGQTAMTSSPHAMLFPALVFSLLLISFNLFGNGLRDAFNPSLRGMED